MCKIAVIADIHGNVQALEAVLDRIDSLGCERTYCLGDVVGYGASPGPCIDLLIAAKVPSLLGNHDALITGQCDGANFNPVSLAAIRYTMDVISTDQLNFLKAMPANLNHGEEALFVHGSPGNRDNYLIGSSKIISASNDLLADAGPGICFFGHTHLPSFFDGCDFWYTTGKRFALDDTVRIMANPGSVGQPRDGDARASFLVWDLAREHVTFERVEYDVARARQDILDVGLPMVLGDRLLNGR